jgi:hypothetical protein
MNSIKTENDFGEVSHSTILELLGSAMTNNELKEYAINKNDTSYLEVVENIFTEEEFILIIVKINSRIVLDRRFEYDCGFEEFFYYLAELRNKYEDKEDED